MSRRPLQYYDNGNYTEGVEEIDSSKNALNNVNFVSAEALLRQALRAEANKAVGVADSAQIGAGYDDIHQCTYVVDIDGKVSCKGCGKGTVKKVSHKKSKKHAKPTKSY